MKNKREIAILGSTGSIGTQTLDVVRANGDLAVAALAAGSNVKAYGGADTRISSSYSCPLG